MDTLALAGADPAAAVRTLADLPAPPGLPWLGHVLKLQPARMHLQLERWAAEFGGPYRISLAGRPVVVISDAESIQAALRDRPQGLRRAGMLRPVFAEMGIDGLFSTEGDAWLPQRKLVMQSLNAGNFRGFFPVLRAITERLYRRWRHAAETGEVLEMTRELVRYTVDVTSALSFGEDPNTIEQSGNVIQDHLASIFPMVMRRTMAPLPTWRWLKLPADRRLDRDLAVVHAYAQRCIERARQRLAAEPGRAPANVLEAMVALAAAPGSDFTDAMVVANVLTLLLGGEDTTAHSLAWTLLYLAQDRALQQRLHGQALAALGDQAVCAQHDALRGLDAFEDLANEAIRLRPVAAFLALEAQHDRVVGGVALPRGTRLFLLTRPAQTSERHYARPQVYDPERWSRAHAGGSMAEAHELRAFLQFGAGPRVCPGRHLAAVELRLVLSMLLRHFEVELACRPEEIEEVLNFTLVPSKMPVRLRVRPATKPLPGAAPPDTASPSAGRCPFGHG